MGNFKHTSITIYEAMENIKKGKYIMPAFQRKFVWTMPQIEKLWDSILAGYPISTFLFWHIDIAENITADTYFFKFLEEASFNKTKKPKSNDYNQTTIDTRITDTAILDGQQRLTALFLSLYGECIYFSGGGRQKTQGNYLDLYIELDKNKANIESNMDSEEIKNNSEKELFNTKNFDIWFPGPLENTSNSSFRIKDILNDEFKNPDTREQAISNVLNYVSADSIDYSKSILEKLCSAIYEEELIHYTEILNMYQDDALEMFVRFNSGGIPLKKFEITMSILEAYWPMSRTAIENVLKEDYEGFGSDFIIRTSLMLFGDVVKSNINNSVALNMKNRWSEVCKSLKVLSQILKDLKININRFKSSWNVLLPIIYVIFYNPNAYNKDNSSYEENIRVIKVYLIRAILFKYFQSGTTGKLKKITEQLKSNNFLLQLNNCIDKIPELKFKDEKLDDVLDSEKGSKIAGEALYFLSLEWRNDNYAYEQDHLHPFANFDAPIPFEVKIEDWAQWHAIRNKLPNLELLEGHENANRKDTPLDEYYEQMNESQKKSFYDHAMIPENVSLNISKFGDFYEKRRELIKDRLTKLMK